MDQAQDAQSVTPAPAHWAPGQPGEVPDWRDAPGLRGKPAWLHPGRASLLGFGARQNPPKDTGQPQPQAGAQCAQSGPSPRRLPLFSPRDPDSRAKESSSYAQRHFKDEGRQGGGGGRERGGSSRTAEASREPRPRSGRPTAGGEGRAAGLRAHPRGLPAGARDSPAESAAGLRAGAAGSLTSRPAGSPAAAAGAVPGAAGGRAVRGPAEQRRVEHPRLLHRGELRRAVRARRSVPSAPGDHPGGVPAAQPRARAAAPAAPAARSSSCGGCGSLGAAADSEQRSPQPRPSAP